MKEAILEKEEQLRLAMIASDVRVLDELIDESLAFISPVGIVVTKQMDLDTHSAGIQKIKELIPSEQSINILDNSAIVTVKMDLIGTYGDMDISGPYRYLRVWNNTSRGWKIVAGSVSKIL